MVFESLVCSVGDAETMSSPKPQRPNNPVIETVIQEEALKPPAIETYFELPVVSPSDPRICPPLETSPPEEYNYADYQREVSMSVFDSKNEFENFPSCSITMISNFKSFPFRFQFRL